MKINLNRGLVFCVGFLFYGLALSAQTLTIYSVNNGNLISNRVSDIFPTAVENVWMRQDMPYYPSLLKKDSAIYYDNDRTGLNPYSNPLIGAYAAQSNATWLVFSRLPGFVEGSFGNSNGGLVRFQNNNFVIFNSQNFPPFSKMREKIWNCSAIEPVAKRIWVGGDSGIRSIDLATFQIKTFFNDSARYANEAFWSRGISSKTGVWFQRYSYKWVFQKADSLVPFINQNFGLADSLLLVDVAFLKTDTFFLTRDLYSTGKATLWKRNNVTQKINLPLTNPALQYLAVERDNLLWILGDSGLLRYDNGQTTDFSMYKPNSGNLSSFKIDESGTKWMGTLDDGLHKLSNLKVAISIPNGNSQSYCYTSPIRFQAQVSSLVGNTFSYFWQFGDGKTSTEAAPAHFYGWTGKFKIRLTVRDEYGAEIKTRDTLLLEYVPNTYLIPISDTLVTCSATTLKTTSNKSVKWTFPNGSTKTDTSIVTTDFGQYIFETLNQACPGKDTIFLKNRATQVSSISFKVSGQDIIAETDTIEIFLPDTLTAREVNGFCAAIWTINGISAGTGNSIKTEITEEGLYSFEVQSSSLDNCKSEGNRNIFIKKKIVIPPVPLFIPSLVTMDGNGKNDVFFIPPIGKEINLTIFNRWGKEIFKAENYKNDWPMSDLDAGVYYYTIKIESEIKNGYVMVVR